MSHFRNTRKGIVARFTEEERRFLGDVIPLLTGVGPMEEDPAARRLDVPVYLDDAAANDEWRRLMGPEIEEARASDRRVFQRTLDQSPFVLSDEQADAFLRVLNEARLVLGARLGIEVEEDHDRVPEDDRWALDYLGWLQEELTAELTRRL